VFAARAPSPCLACCALGPSPPGQPWPDYVRITHTHAHGSWVRVTALATLTELCEDTMATITKHAGKTGVRYHVKIRLAGYAPETASFERRTDAVQWAALTESNMRAGRHFSAAKSKTFADLANEYRPHSKAGSLLSFWVEIFGRDLLADIAPHRIAKVRDLLLAEKTRRKRKRSGPTVNRYLAQLSSAMTFAVKELGWVERNPVLAVRKNPESKGRVRFLSDDERATLLYACRMSDNTHLYSAVVLSLLTGARQAEIMGLRWRQIDLKRRLITLPKTKNGDQRALPLVGEALAILTERAKVRCIDDDRLFPSGVAAGRKVSHF
jgi:integrase